MGKIWKRNCVNKHIGGNIDPELISKLSKKSYADGRNALANLTYEERVANQLKGAITKSVEFQVRDPNGKIHTGKGIYPFAKKHGLNGANFWELVRGRYDSYKGWTNIDVDPSTLLTYSEKCHKMVKEGKGIWSKESKENLNEVRLRKMQKNFMLEVQREKLTKGRGAIDLLESMDCR